MTALPVHVALVNRSKSIDRAELGRVAGALNEQVHADFAPAWHGYALHATVGPYADFQPNTWSIMLQDGIDEQGALGYHSDSNKQPYAVVDVSRGDWSVTASHELLEMLADPFGNRMHAAKHLPGWPGHGRVHYLVEVCDPCEATSYEVQGVAVSDFLLPAYYRSSHLGVPVSRVGGVTEPVTVSDGGYISFVDDTGMWWQLFVQSGESDFQQIGRDTSSFGSLREFSDHHARQYLIDKGLAS